MGKRILDRAPILLSLLFLLALVWPERERALRGQNDFSQLYAGARLAVTPDLYNRAANLSVIQAIHGFTMQSVVYTRPPFYAALLWPLGRLPYPAAYAIFSLATFSSLLWFVLRFSKECPALPFFASMSLPAATAICGGQDTPFLLAIAGASILATRRKKDFMAGLLLSLCAIKFHLFLFVPILLVLNKRWRMIGGGAAGLAILTALGVCVSGPASLLHYINVLRDPWINPDPAYMPNLHGLAASLHGGFALELALSGATVALFFWIAKRTRDFEFLLAAAFVCGLLVSFHSTLPDDLLLLPVFVLILASSADAWLRSAAALVLTPVAAMLVLAGSPFTAIFPASLAILLALMVRASREEAAVEAGKTSPVLI